MNAFEMVGQMLQKSAVVTDDAGMDAIIHEYDKFTSCASQSFLRSIPNPKRVGTKDVYLVWIDKRPCSEYIPLA